MFNILIIEDDIYQRKNLITMINELNEDYKIFEADCEEEALKISNENKIDLFYVDVELKNSSGLEFAKKIREDERYKIKWIVFMTTHVNYMLEAFREIHCYDYIIKPYDKEKVKKMTLVLSNDKREQSIVKRKYVVFNMKGIEMKIYVDEIIFIEIFLRTCSIHTLRGEFVVGNISLKKIKEMLEDTNIIQSYRSYLINLDHISKIDKSNATWYVYFENYNKNVPVGNNFKNCLQERFK